MQQEHDHNFGGPWLEPRYIWLRRHPPRKIIFLPGGGLATIEEMRAGRWWTNYGVPFYDPDFPSVWQDGHHPDPALDAAVAEAAADAAADVGADAAVDVEMPDAAAYAT